MSEKRFVAHDTSVEDYVEIHESKRREDENEARCEIAGRMFGKQRERRARSAHSIDSRIKQVSFGVYSLC